jgi:hypothetical protein
LKLRLERHAAHYQGGGGHDLEWIETTPAVVEYGQDQKPVRPKNLPNGFEYHSGFRDQYGVQTFLWCRKAPLSAGRCGRCP